MEELAHRASAVVRSHDDISILRKKIHTHTHEYIYIWIIQLGNYFNVARNRIIFQCSHLKAFLLPSPTPPLGQF